MRDEGPHPLRTLLWVPGDRPQRIAKAAAAGASGIAVDLEDAVALSRKAEARQTAAAAIHDLPTATSAVTVRVNAPTTGLTADDVAALTPVLHRVAVVIIPMSCTPEDVQQVSALLDVAETAADLPTGTVRLIPLVETAAGIIGAGALGTADPRVLTLAFGPADLSSDLRVTPTARGDELFVARSLLVLAAAAAGLAAPIDGPHLDLADPDGLAVSAARARELGFGGKQVLHPNQLGPVVAAFGPDAAELDWARRVDEAFTAAEASGVSSLRLADGTFVDYPVALRARALLTQETESR